MFIPADTLDDLLRRALQAIAEHGIHVQASRGANRELVGVLLKLTNPLARLSQTETKGKPIGALGELAWYLAASDDADFITYYLPAYEKEREIDGSIHGAYGPRMFTAAWHNQFESIIELLRQKPSTRKAVIQLFDCEDLAGTYKDVPCTCTLQFLVRNDRLDLIASMRSNDAFKGLPHDVFAFTMIQEVVARTLGFRLGAYIHFAGSLHLYDEDAGRAQAFIGEGVQGRVGNAMRPMPADGLWPAIRVFLQAEAALRGGSPVPAQRVTALDPYWQDLVRLLQIFRCVKDDQLEQISAIKEQITDPLFREYISAREKRD